MSDPSHKPTITRNLQARIAVALTMIPIALVFVWLGGWWMTAMCAVSALVLGYEWAMMAGLPRRWAMMGAAAVPVVFYMHFGLVYALATMWIAGLAAALIQKQSGRDVIRTLLGAMYTAGMPLAFLVLREGNWDGRAAALIMMAMVWASDSGAYFSGRTIGGPLLSPRNSPNKTWSGAIGAVVVTGLCGLIASHILEVPPLRWVVFAALLSVVCQYGDLIESKIKREFGAKDASSLLPGHGGLMDRVDGLALFVWREFACSCCFPRYQFI